MARMAVKEIIFHLERWNEWRRGERDEQPTSSARYGEIVDEAILRLRETLTRKRTRWTKRR